VRAKGERVSLSKEFRYRVALEKIVKMLEGIEGQCEAPNSCMGGCPGCRAANVAAFAHNTLLGSDD
jgi:aromatic ring hydroxylase